MKLKEFTKRVVSREVELGNKVDSKFADELYWRTVMVHGMENHGPLWKTLSISWTTLVILLFVGTLLYSGKENGKEGAFRIIEDLVLVVIPFTNAGYALLGMLVGFMSLVVNVFWRWFRWVMSVRWFLRLVLIVVAFGFAGCATMIRYYPYSSEQRSTALIVLNIFSIVGMIACVGTGATSWKALSDLRNAELKNKYAVRGQDLLCAEDGTRPPRIDFDRWSLFKLTSSGRDGFWVLFSMPRIDYTKVERVNVGQVFQYMVVSTLLHRAIDWLDGCSYEDLLSNHAVLTVDEQVKMASEWLSEDSRGADGVVSTFVERTRLMSKAELEEDMKIDDKDVGDAMNPAGVFELSMFQNIYLSPMLASVKSSADYYDDGMYRFYFYHVTDNCLYMHVVTKSGKGVGFCELKASVDAFDADKSESRYGFAYPSGLKVVEKEGGMYEVSCEVEGLTLRTDVGVWSDFKTYMTKRMEQVVLSCRDLKVRELLMGRVRAICDELFLSHCALETEGGEGAGAAGVVVHA